MRLIIFIFTLIVAQNAYAQTLTEIITEPVSGEESAPVLTEPTSPEQRLEQLSANAAATPAATGNAPLEITADNTLEWQRNEKTFIARGNAVATQGDSSVAAATLTAHYDEKQGGGMKVSRVIAEDNVVIKSRDAQAFGAKADYDLDKGYAIMTGNDLRMTSPEQTVTAREKFEYWTTDGRFTAIGAAKVHRGQDTLAADRISAIMKNDAKGERTLETLEANNNVTITTPTEIVTGNYAIYRAGTNKAEIKGNVKIRRGPNILEGDRADVDLTTNTSRIFGAPAAGGRVKAVFYPSSEKKQP